MYDVFLITLLPTVTHDPFGIFLYCKLYKSIGKVFFFVLPNHFIINSPTVGENNVGGSGIGGGFFILLTLISLVISSSHFFITGFFSCSFILICSGGGSLAHDGKLSLFPNLLSLLFGFITLLLSFIVIPLCILILLSLDIISSFEIFPILISYIGNSILLICGGEIIGDVDLFGIINLGDFISFLLSLSLLTIELE